MKRLIGSLLAALVPLAGVLVALSAGPPAASAAPAAGTSGWSTLEHAALQATAGYRGDGSLTVVGSPSSISTSTVTTPSGRISVAQRTVVTTDGSGTVVLTLALLGGSQLVVNEMSPAAGRGETLVLQPGSSTVAGAYPLRGTARSDTPLATPLTTVPGGCYADPQAPGVIGSDFGPLVQGEGVIECGDAESLSEIVSLYRGTTHVGTTATGSGGGIFLGVDAYDGCTVITGTHSFHTAELWSVNGVVEGGATSSGASLHCT